MLFAGIDLGGTTIKGALVNEEGIIIRSKSIPTGGERPHREIVLDMANLIVDLAKEEGIGLSEIARVGIGSPGTIDVENGVVVFANNFADFKNVPVRAIMQEVLPGMPIYMENDANVAALGENLFGAGRGKKSTVLITIGTGLGSGIIIDGKIFSGGFGGGEIGHTVIVADGKPCTCGRNGCWEAYSSATGMVRMAKEAIGRHPESVMAARGDELNAWDIRKAEQSGDAAAVETLEEYYHYMAIGLVNVINVFRPDAVILGGGPSADGELLRMPLYDRVAEKVYGGRMDTELLIATLGNKAGIIGAAFLQD